MNIKVLIALLICLLPVHKSFTQEIPANFVWSENPGFSNIPEEYQNENVVGIFLYEKYEYYHNSEGELQHKHSLHRRFRLNDSESVNSFNKISVSLSNVLEVTEIKARVIKPDGRLIEFDKNNIKEITDEESGNNFKIFAIDGIETGDEIEYLIVKDVVGGTFGRAFFQFAYPVQNASFELITPSNLIYAAKGYNGFPDPVLSEMEDGRNRLFSEKENITALKDVEYAYFHPRRARIEFKLEHNLLIGRAKLLTWNDAAQRVYDIMYQDVNPRTMRRWMRDIDVKEGIAYAQAAQIEEYLKSNVFVQDYNVPEFNDLDFIRTNKVSGEQGIMRLYVNLFKELNIEHEIVITSDRTVIPLDPDFESWNYLDKYLIYLPGENAYIDPIDDFNRIGCIDGDYTATHGLFVSLVTIGSFESAVGNIKYIEPTPFNYNFDNMNIEISIDVEKAETRILNTRGFKGLSGGSLAWIYPVIDEERREEFLKGIMETVAPNPEFNSLTVLESGNVDFLHDAEFVISSDFMSQSFIEFAGNRLLLKVGESIGPQKELYQDEEREFGGDSGFNRWFCRKITLEIPEGYRILNPEAADMNVVEGTDDEIAFAFISSHSFQDNYYIIEIDEYYKRVEVQPAQFEGFRDVINAAADFNKIVLVLEKL
ncbi:MAG: DUF3857 domain-containing protein [Bacteroidetes bacterium]|nr:MAG: DUF3857 domain-containing protein [Bacteroidota bacterium]